MSKSPSPLLDFPDWGWVVFNCLPFALIVLASIYEKRELRAHSHQLRALSRCTARRLNLNWKAIRTPIPPEFHKENMNELAKMSLNASAEVFCGAGARQRLDHPSPELLRYLRRVAHPDPLAGGWDALITSKHTRRYLIHAVILRVLEERVFSSLFFGACERHLQWLKDRDHDERLVDAFHRKRLRCQANLTYMKVTAAEVQVPNEAPPRFWTEVDYVAAQLTILLLPFHPRNRTDTATPSIEYTYQRLHNVVAKAAYLTVALCLVPDLVTFEWPEPGHASELWYTDCNSKQLQRSVTLAERLDKQYNCPVGRRARVQISVRPDMRMHWRIFDALGNPRVRTQSIWKPSAVFYWGYFDSRKDADVHVPFHVTEEKSVFFDFLERWIVLWLCVQCLFFAVSSFPANALTEASMPRLAYATSQCRTMIATVWDRLRHMQDMIPKGATGKTEVGKSAGALRSGTRYLYKFFQGPFRQRR